MQRRSDLEATRDILRQHLDTCPPAYVAAIAKQYAAVLKELDELPNGDAEVSPLDELRAARAARSAADPVPAGRRSQSRRRGRLSAG